MPCLLYNGDQSAHVVPDSSVFTQLPVSLRCIRHVIHCIRHDPTTSLQYIIYILYSMLHILSLIIIPFLCVADECNGFPCVLMQYITFGLYL